MEKLNIAREKFNKINLTSITKVFSNISRSKQDRILLTLLLLLSLSLSVYFAVKGHVLRRTGAASAKVYFNQSTVTVSGTKTFTLVLLTDSFTIPIAASRVEITFDKSKLNLASEITSSSKLKRVFEKTLKSQTDTCITTCKIVIAQGLDPIDKNTPPVGIFDLASMNFVPATTANDVQTIISIGTSMFVDNKTAVVPYTITNTTVTINPTSPTPTVNISPTPTKVPTPTNTPAPTGPIPTLSDSSGIWISSKEIMSLPMSGSAWNSVQSAANGNWGSANLGDNNSMHDVYTLAGALVAIRTGDSSMRNKTITGLQSAMGSPLNRALELSRGLQTYIIAADIINYHDSAFENWVRSMLNANVSPHTGGSSLCNPSGTSFDCSGVGGVVCTALRSANNWGGHARASMAAGALYLKDQQLTQDVVNAHKAFIGIAVQNHLYCESTNWHADPNNKTGVNRLGSTIQGRDVSGVLPEDWRRGGEFAWPPTLSGYMWEGMQGFVVTAAILHRAGMIPFNSGDNAVVRAMNILYNGINNPPSGDDTWQPWVVNYYAGTSFPTSSANPGKNMGWTDWTFAK